LDADPLTVVPKGATELFGAVASSFEASERPPLSEMVHQLILSFPTGL
jgi:hypothetical protein